MEITQAALAENLRICQAQIQVLTQQIALVRQVRDIYEARLAETFVLLQEAQAKPPVPEAAPQEPRGD